MLGSEGKEWQIGLAAGTKLPCKVSQKIYFLAVELPLFSFPFFSLRLPSIVEGFRSGLRLTRSVSRKKMSHIRLLAKTSYPTGSGSSSEILLIRFLHIVLNFHKFYYWIAMVNKIWNDLNQYKLMHIIFQSYRQCWKC